jgi:hypothetical protein
VKPIVVIATSVVSNITRKYFNSDDSEVMSKALANSQLTIDNTTIDIHHAALQCGFLLLILPLAKE